MAFAELDLNVISRATTWKMMKSFPRVAKAAFSSGTSKTQQEKAREFLASIGVREVGEAEQVEVILKQRYSQGSIKPREQDMERFIELVEKEGKADLFSEYFIFQLESGKWAKPGTVFLDIPYLDTGLRVYYKAIGEGSDRKWALSPQYKESGVATERLAKFAEAVGVQTSLQVVETSTYENPNLEYLLEVGGERSTSPIDRDYVIPKLDELLKTPNEKLSKLVWLTMKGLPKRYLKATYQRNWRHGSRTSNSQLVHHLRNAAWISQKEDETVYFVKPCDASIERLPSKGFPYEAGQEWLRSIEFGKSERDRRDLERRKQERQTKDYQRKDTAAEELGFSSVEEAHEAKEMVALKHKDPEGFKRWHDRNRKRASFPTSPIRNSKRRRERLGEQHADAPKKEYKTRERSVRITRGEIAPETWLKNQYTNDDDQMICQICKDEMPFKKRDGDYYFEAVENLFTRVFYQGA